MHGFHNVVGILGTSLTEDQVVLLKRYVNSAILIFDPDQAGKKATIRGLNILGEHELEAKVVPLPYGYDPASLLQENKEAFLSFLPQAQELTTYRLNEAILSYNKSSVEGKLHIIKDLSDIIKSIKSPMKQHEFISKIANAIEEKEEYIASEVKFFLKEEGLLGQKNVEKEAPLFGGELLLKAILERENLKEILISCMSDKDFQDERMREIFSIIKRNPSFKMSELMNLLSEPARNLLAKLAMKKMQTEETDLGRKLINLKLEKLQMERKYLNEKIQQAFSFHEANSISSLRKRFWENKKLEKEIKKINIDELSLQELIEKLKLISNIIYEETI
jgi:DNA primase